MKNTTCSTSGKAIPRNPNMLVRSRTSLLAVGALICSVAGAPQLWAQSVGLQTQYRLVSISAGSEVRANTGFVGSPTPLVNHDTNNGVLGGSISDASIDVSTYYGDMSVTGSGYASNSPTNGTGVTIDTPVGGAPFSMYQDVLNVTSSTLAKGTAVTIDFTESFVTSLVFTGTGLGLRDFQDNLNITDKNSLDQTHLTLAGTSSDSFVFHTAVGDSLYVEGELHGNADIFAGDSSIDPYTGFPKPEGGSFSFYESGPLYITSVTSGADVQSESGATYAPSSSVPDTTSTLGLLGLAMAGLVLVRRQLLKKSFPDIQLLYGNGRRWPVKGPRAGLRSLRPMNPIGNLTGWAVAILSVAAISIGASRAHAGTFGLETSYGLVSTQAPGEIRVDTGLVSSPTALLNSDTNSGSKGGASTSSSISVSNYYGNMSVTGSGSSSNSASYGSFALIDTWSGTAGNMTKYVDYLDVTSSTLAVGTDVTIDFTESFAASATMNAPLRPTPITFLDHLNIQDTLYGSVWNLNLTSTGSASNVLHTQVGDRIFLEGDLTAYGAQAYTNPIYPFDPTDRLYTADFSFSMSGPLSITSVTDGVDLVSGSGATYAPASSVPDSTATITLLGIGLLALAAVRRKSALSRDRLCRGIGLIANPSNPMKSPLNFAGIALGALAFAAITSPVAYAQTLPDSSASTTFYSGWTSQTFHGTGSIDYSGPNGTSGSSNIIGSTDPSISVTANVPVSSFMSTSAMLEYSFEVVWTGAGLPANSVVPINIQGSLFGTAASYIGYSDAQINTAIGSLGIYGTGATVPFDFSGSVGVDTPSTIILSASAYTTSWQGFSVTDTVDPVITIDTNPADWQGSVDPNNYAITFSPDLAPSSVPDGSATLGLLGLAMGGLVLLRRRLPCRKVGLTSRSLD